MDRINIRDPNFIEIKTKRSQTARALNSIAQQKLKPYYNTIYQLLQLQQPPNDSYDTVVTKINQKINKNMPHMILNRRINQQTLEFKIVKPLQKRKFSNQTKSSSTKKCKSMTKFYVFSKQEQERHQNKDQLRLKFDVFRKLSKTFSQTTLKDKKKYNILDKYQQMIKHHYQNLELDPQYISEDKDEEHKITQQNQQFRYKLQANKWIENILISNEEEHQSLIRRQKAKYLRQQGSKFSQYKGIKDTDIDECKEIVQQDPELFNLSLSHTVATTNVTQVKSMFELTRQRLSNLMNQYKTSRKMSPQRRSPQRTNFIRKNSIFSSPQKPFRRKTSIQSTQNYRQYKKFKQTQNQNPQTYKIGDRYSNFRCKQDKRNMLTKLKQYQKTKYTTKVMDITRHRNLFLKEKGN